jgi:glycosyltransferase involved in cell wall biosynthesis
MRIAINTRFLLQDRLEGLGLYTHEICHRMVKEHPDVDFHFLFDRPFSQNFIYGDNVTPHVIFPQARHPFLWYWWLEWSLPRYLNQINPDVFLSPDGFTSLRYKGKKATVIHDLGFEHYPQHVPSLVGRFYRKYTPRFCQTSDHIFTVSQATMDDIVDLYNIRPSKMSVAYNGCRDGFGPISDHEIMTVRKKISNGQPYFLFVGALHPRKNIGHLLRSFDKFRENKQDFKLVVTGRKAWMNSEMEATYKAMKHSDDVVFLGYQNKEDLCQTTAAAYACLYPSLFEGFGVPLLEAMTSAVPVIASDRSAIPEIVGGAGLLVNPHSVDSTVGAMNQLVEDKRIRLKCIEQGLEQSEKFSWQATADRIYTTLISLT